jgi:hypothetical protein
MHGPRSLKHWLRGILPDILAALLIGGLLWILLTIRKWSE